MQIIVSKNPEIQIVVVDVGGALLSEDALLIYTFQSLEKSSKTFIDFNKLIGYTVS
jgi:hypothetical protein